MAIIRKTLWCSKCASEKLQVKGKGYWLCKTCFTENTGKHPAESCQAVKDLQAELHDKTRKEMNRQRVFPQLPHSQHQRTTVMGSRSIKIQMFKRFK
jgi:ribosomal protein L37AE/L43A